MAMGGRSAGRGSRSVVTWPWVDGIFYFSTFPGPLYFPFSHSCVMAAATKYDDPALNALNAAAQPPRIPSRKSTVTAASADLAAEATSGPVSGTPTELSSSISKHTASKCHDVQPSSKTPACPPGLKLGPVPDLSALNILVDAADEAKPLKAPSPIENPIDHDVVLTAAASSGSAMPASDPLSSEEGIRTPGRQWKDAIRKGASNVIARLDIREEKLQDSAAILKRIHAGASIDGDKKLKDAMGMPMGCRGCFLVHREGGNSPFQVQVGKSRILAHNVLYAAYYELSKERMDIIFKGALQVRQNCLHTNGSWFCIEPTHLNAVKRGGNEPQHPIPRQVADAIYQTRRPPGSQAEVNDDITETDSED